MFFYKKESCLQDSTPAAGRICDIVLLRRSAIPVELFLCNRNEISYYIRKKCRMYHYIRH